MPDIYSPLQKYFGYSQYRPLQEDIIKSILQKNDTFVLMPTGGGKSLCYQIPSLVLPGTTIVISPLISLMKDQVDTLQQNGIKAAFLNSSLSQAEQLDVLDRLHTNDLSLLYVAPERLVQSSFLETLSKISINFFAIDEAHCISQWGHDFRPEYRKLDIIRMMFPDKPIVALTATATPRVKADIIERLEFRNAAVYQASFNRPNLTYTVIAKNNPYDQLIDYIFKRKGEAGIVYCQSRQTVKIVTRHLIENGVKARAYHAGLDDLKRSENQDAFIKEDTEVIVATIAFGMGIDKSNVRFVIHYNLPKSLEHYYQETGRAGRDGLASECLLLFNHADKFTYERFIREMGNETEQMVAIQQLNKVIDFAHSSTCRRYQLLQYFGEESSISNCANCDNCTAIRETFDATIETQKIMSCIFHVKGRFGLAQIVNILLGSKAEKILDYNHHKLSTYGLMKDYSRNDIKSFIYELIHLGYINQSTDQYGLLGLTAKCKAVLEGKENVFLAKPVPTSTVTDSKRSKKTTYQNIKNRELFEVLRTLRKQLADDANVPPYVIFSDATLIDMTHLLPKNRHDFRKVKGVGDMKLEKYGDIFLAEIIRYLNI